MNKPKLISYQTLDKSLQNLSNPKNNTPFFKKSIMIKFSPAKIINVTMYLSMQPKSIITELRIKDSKQNNKDNIFIKMNYICQENNKYTYNSVVDSNTIFSLLLCNVQQDHDNVGFYSITINGISQENHKQTKLDEFFLKPTQIDNEQGSFQPFIASITQNKDPAGRSEQKKNILKLKEQAEIDQAIEKSLIEQQYEKLQQQQYEEQVFEEESLEIIMQNEIQEQYQQTNRNNFQDIKSLGYTDSFNQNHTPKQREFGLKAQKYQIQHREDNNPIKLYCMTKFKAEDIDQKFMTEHNVWEISNGRKRGFLRDVMYKN